MSLGAIGVWEPDGQGRTRRVPGQALLRSLAAPPRLQASGPGATCAGVLSLYWVTVGLQLLFLLSAAVCAAAQSIHSFRSTLWSLGATATALGIKTANQAYSTLPLFAFANVSSGVLASSGPGGATRALMSPDCRAAAASPTCRPSVVPAAPGLRRSGGRGGGRGPVHRGQPGGGLLR